MSLELASSKTIVTNVVATFFEGFLAAWAVTSNATSKEALIGAAAAGGSVVWNTIIKPYLKAQRIL